MINQQRKDEKQNLSMSFIAKNITLCVDRLWYYSLDGYSIDDRYDLCQSTYWLNIDLWINHDILYQQSISRYNNRLYFFGN